MSGSGDLFPGFTASVIDAGEVGIFCRTGGRGPPLVLLHGYPQTHAAWHRVAQALSAQFTVVLLDLRGYGQSTCPPSDSGHEAYSKRSMAGDVAHVMNHLGFKRFGVMAHDRGARVAYRLALDQPALVECLVLLDIMSTWDQMRPDLQRTGGRPPDWNFLAQPAPIPETLIGADPTTWLEARLRRATLAGSTSVFDSRALAEYERCLSDSDRIHATCEDYRAGATCDLTADRMDREAGRRIEQPALVVWGTHGNLAHIADPLELWRPWFRQIDGHRIDSGHYIAEENPEALLRIAMPFLRRSFLSEVKGSIQ